MAAQTTAINRRERLLQVGIEAFSGGEYESVSTEQIAARAGVAQGLLFHYFGTKRGFYVEVGRRVLGSVRESFAAHEQADPVRWLREEIDIFLSGLLEHPPDQLTAGIGLLPELRELIEDQMAWGVRRVLDRMGIGEPRPLLDIAMRGWMASAIAIGRHWVSTPAVPRRQARDLIITSLNDTLAGVAAGDRAAGFDPRFFLPR